MCSETYDASRRFEFTLASFFSSFLCDYSSSSNLHSKIRAHEHLHTIANTHTTARNDKNRSEPNSNASVTKRVGFWKWSQSLTTMRVWMHEWIPNNLAHTPKSWLLVTIDSLICIQMLTVRFSVVSSQNSLKSSNKQARKLTLFVIRAIRLKPGVNRHNPRVCLFHWFWLSLFCSVC